MRRVREDIGGFMSRNNLLPDSGVSKWLQSAALNFYKSSHTLTLWQKKIRTKKIVSEASLNFLKVSHGAQNRGSLFFPLRIWRGEFHAAKHDF